MTSHDHHTTFVLPLFPSLLSLLSLLLPSSSFLPLSVSQLSEEEQRSKVLCLLLHMADISHPGKPWQLHQQWTSRLIEEFFQQGDKEREKGLECSPLCDRNNTLIPESQLGEGEAKSERT